MSASINEVDSVLQRVSGRVVNVHDQLHPIARKINVNTKFKIFIIQKHDEKLCKSYKTKMPSPVHQTAINVMYKSLLHPSLALSGKVHLA